MGSLLGGGRAELGPAGHITLSFPFQEVRGREILIPEC